MNFPEERLFMVLMLQNAGVQAAKNVTDYFVQGSPRAGCTHCFAADCTGGELRSCLRSCQLRPWPPKAGAGSRADATARPAGIFIAQASLILAAPVAAAIAVASCF